MIKELLIFRRRMEDEAAAAAAMEAANNAEKNSLLSSIRSTLFIHNLLWNFTLQRVPETNLACNLIRA